jgi:ribonuclease E
MAIERETGVEGGMDVGGGEGASERERAHESEHEHKSEHKSEHQSEHKADAAERAHEGKGQDQPVPEAKAEAPAPKAAERERDRERAPAKSSGSKRQLIINYQPGEECRVAVVNNGRMDEFYSEKRDAVSHVGNIYVGRVTNVEPAIQAAFIDFGLEHSGFLHVSDVHPLYFPDAEGGEATERVGKKTPRRERPPIQDCFKRGQEVVVQVLKEGVGSKGPSLTSYLSIPGRYLVMMPQMDNVGVSRKVEDEDLRKKMVNILDQLDLPEGFGFILRTAGLDRTKTELKRDLAYLMRLQKDMERRRKSSSKPRLLYAESDLLLRALRDMLTADTDEVVIDSEAGLKRAGRFMRIFSPRSSTRLLHYRGHAPIFHALHIEEQIRTMYSREVPLPSGGRLVIDEAEALVAIDVNSGKSRSAGDSEENAYHTNLEAVEEICRQLRLRDLGGIVINDLIDMRSAKHRREIEGKFNSILETDRARSTVLPISDFGVLELTRQRMRGSHESIHFHDCPTCRGRGMIQRPESVAADAIRDLAALLDQAKVSKVEMVVHPRLAGELLSHRRKHLSRLEKAFGKALMVRLSDATPLDRVTFYAYDAQGNDLEIDRLPRLRPQADQLVEWSDPNLPEEGDELESFVDDDAMEDQESEGVDDEPEGQDEPHLMEVDPRSEGDGAGEGENFSLASMGGRKKKRRRGRGGGGGGGGGGPQGQQGQQQQQQRASQPVQRPAAQAGDDAGAPAGEGQPGAPEGAGGAAGGEGEGGEGGRRRRRRRRGGRGRNRAMGAEGQPMPAQAGDDEPVPGVPVMELPEPGPEPEPGAPLTLGRLARQLRVRTAEVIGHCLDNNIDAAQVENDDTVLTPELEAQIRLWFARPKPDMSQPEQAQAARRADAAPERDAPASDAPARAAADEGEDGEGDDEPDDAPAGAEGAAQGAGGQGAGGPVGEGGEGGRRRRRRRRGGRGRNRGGEGGGPGGQASGAAGGSGGGGGGGHEQAPATNHTPTGAHSAGGEGGGGHRDRGDRGDRGRDRDRDRGRGGRGQGGGGGGERRTSPSGPAPEPKPLTPSPSPSAFPMGAPPAKPPVRTLYGAVIRKLKPGQAGSSKREE